MSKTNQKPQIGTFFKRTDRGTGELLTDEKGRQLYTFVLNKDVEISINGKKYGSKFFYVNRPDEKLDIMLKNGTMQEEEYERKVARFQEGGDLSNVVFEIKSAE